MERLLIQKTAGPFAALTPHWLNSKVKCGLERKFKTTVLPLKRKLPEIFFEKGFRFTYCLLMNKKWQNTLVIVFVFQNLSYLNLLTC